MSEVIHPEVQKDLDNGFILTGDAGEQRYKKVASGHYEFKTGYSNYCVSVDGHEFPIGETSGTVIFYDLSDDEKENAISAYYDSLENLKEECSHDEESFKFLVCECYYETELEI